MKLTLGRKIRELRVRKGLTQSELSEGLVTPSMISQIESDKANPSHPLLQAIAEKLETPIEYFLTDIEAQLEKISEYKVAHAVMQKGDYKQAIDLLSKIKEAPSTQISMVDVKYDLAYCYAKTGELDKASILFEECLNFAITTKDTIQQIVIMNQLGEVTYHQRNYPIANHYWSKGFALAKKQKDIDPYLLGQIANGIGKIHSQLNEWDKAKEYFDEAAKAFKGSQNIREIADVYVDLAKAYRKTHNYDKAVEYSEAASALYQGIESLQTIIDTVANLGVVFGETGSTPQAIDTLTHCMTLYQNGGFPERAGHVHSSLARALFKDGQHDAAVEHCKIALDLNFNDELEKAVIYRILATIDLEKGNYPDARSWIEKSTAIVEKIGASSEKIKVYSVYGDIYKQQGLYREAMECLEKMNGALVENLRDQKVMI